MSLSQKIRNLIRPAATTSNNDVHAHSWKLVTTRIGDELSVPDRVVDGEAVYGTFLDEWTCDTCGATASSETPLTLL